MFLAVSDKKQLLTPPKNGDFLGEKVDEFLMIKSYQLKPKSVKTYSESLATMVTFLGSETPADSVTERDAAEWLQSLTAQRSPSGVFQCWQTARFFWGWFYAEDPHRSPLARIRMTRPKSDPIRGINRQQVEKILKVIEGPNRDRDRAIFAILFCTGLRKQEFTGIKVRDVNPGTGTISVSTATAKRSKFRQVTATGKALLYLRRYIKQLTDTRPDAPLWQSAAGKPLTASGIHEILKRGCIAAKLPEVYDFHDFRRGCALELSRQGADIKAISHFLGHSDIKTTERYIALDDSDSVRIATQFNPLG